MNEEPLKILMLEDNDADAIMIQRLLKKHNSNSIFNVVMTEPAYHKALTSFNPDIVLSDNEMPQYSGLEALQHLKKQQPEIPFILITGTVSEEFAVSVIKAGADDYLLKDRLTRLPAAIEVALKQKQTAQEKLEAIEHLKKSEEKYRNLIEFASDGIVIYNQQGQYIEVNERVCATTGYSKKEFEQLNIRELLVLEDDPTPLRLDELSQDKPILQERKVRRKDGSIFTVEISAKLLKDGNFFAIIRDLTERIEAAQKLTQSQERFRALIENSYDSFTLKDAHFKTIYRSPSSARLVGWTDEDMEADNGTKFIHPDDIPLATMNYIDCLANPGKPINTITRFLHKDGRYIWTEGTITNMLQEENIRAIVYNFRDVTDRIEADEKLKASEKQFRYTLDNMLEGVQIIDLNWKYIYANDSSLKHSKYSREELLGYTVMEKFPGIEQTEIFKVYQRCFNEHVSIHMENEFEFPDKTTGWFELSFQPVPKGIFILSVDISERKKAELQLAQNEKRFKAMAENNEGIITLLDEDFQPMFRSESAERITGWKMDDLRAAGQLNYIHPDDLELAAVIMKKAMENPATAIGTKFRLKHKDGHYLWMEGMFNNLLHDPAVNGIVSNLRDVTERIEAEQKIIKANRLYHFISQINQMIVRTANETTLFEEVCHIAIEYGQFKMAWISLIDEENKLVLPAVYAGDENGYLASIKPISTEDIPEGNGPTGRAIREGKYVLCNDIENDPCMALWKEEAISRGYQSTIALPISELGKIIGTFTVYATDKNFFDAEEIELLQEATEDIAFALEVFEKEKLRKQAEELLQEEKDKIDRIAATTPGLIYSFRKYPDGSFGFPYASDAIEEIFGIAQKEVVKNATKIYRRCHPDEVERLLKNIENCVQQVIEWKEEFRYLHPTKGEIWLEGKSIPKQEKDGSVIWHGIIIDVTERKKADEKLKEQKAQLQILGDNLPGVMIFQLVATLEGERHFSYVSNGVTAITGKTPEEAMEDPGLLYRIVLDEDLPHLMMAEFKAYETMSVFNTEVRCRNYKGEIRWLNIISVPRKLDDGRVVWDGFNIDITERKNKDALIVANEKRFRKLVENGNDAFVILNTEGRPKYVSSSVERVIGYSEEEVYDMDILSLTHPDHIQTVLDTHALVLASPGIPITSHISRILHKDGTYHWYEDTITNLIDDPDIGGIVDNFRDITERINREEAIKNSEEKRRLIMNASLDAIISVDTKGMITFWNPQAEVIFGWKEEEVMGKPMAEIVLPERIRSMHDKVFKNYLQTGKSAVMNVLQELTAVNRHNVEFPIEITVLPIKQGDEEFFCAFIRDITERKNSEEALKESEETFAKIFYLNPSVCALNDLQDDKFIDVNQAFLQYFGFTKEEVIGKTSADLGIIVPDNRNELINHMEDHGILHNEETTMYTKSGEKKDVLLSTSNIYIKDKEYAFTISVDITERKKAEEAIRANEEKYRVLVEEASEGIFISDPSGKFITVNTSACKMAQYSEEELLKMSIYDFFIQEDLEQRPLQFEALKEGKTVMRERILKRRDGGINHLEITSKLLTDGRMLSLARDVAERKKAEAALISSEERYRTLVEQATDGIFISDISGKFIMVNSSGCNMSGYTAAELKEKTIYNLVDQEELAGNPFHFEEMKQPKGARSERKMLRKDGAVMDVEINAKFLSDNRFIAFVSDITERKKAAESILLSNERYNMVSKATNDSIWELNVITEEITRTGDGFKTLFGYEVTDYNKASLHWTKLIHPDDLQMVKESQEQAFNNPDEFYWEQEYRFLKLNQDYAFVYDKGYIIRDNNGKAIRMIGATQDITKLRENEINLIHLNMDLQTQAKELADSYRELEQFAYVASHDLQEPLRMVSSFLILIEKNYGDAIDERGRQYINFAVEGAKRMRQIILDLLELSRVGRKDGDMENLDLNLILHEMELIFVKDIEEKNAVIQYGKLPEVYALKSAMLQVFQNLIGNAIKYRKEGVPAEIRIEAVELPSHWQFAVSDNGIGIDKDYYERIFVVFQRLHNKNEYSGTGIGLAISKKIVENLGGKIWVESEPGKGSIFYFTIKK